MTTTNEVQILKLERLKRRINNNWKDSPSIKVTFADLNTPDIIKANHVGMLDTE